MLKQIFLVAGILTALGLTTTTMTNTVNAACTGNPHDRDAPTGNPHDGGETGNPYDSGGHHGDEVDACHGAK
jgi:hypothetical protein